MMQRGLYNSSVLIHKSHRHIAAFGNGDAKPSCRCCASETKHAELQCVRIEHNRDSSTTYFFSEAETAPLWQQLEAQLAATTPDVLPVPAEGSEAVRPTEGSEAVRPAEAVLTSQAAEHHPVTLSLRECENGSKAGSTGLPQGGCTAGSSVSSSSPVEENAGSSVPSETRKGSTIRSDVRAKLERSWSESDDEVPEPSGQKSRRFRKHPRQSAGNFAHATLAGMKEAEEETLELLCKFSELCRVGQLDAALTAFSRFVKADRKDVLVRLRQKHFLKEAARQKSAKAVAQAIRFVQQLPRIYASLQTYNMLVTVCTRAGDVAAALQSADMLRAAGMKPDTALYTNLISACAAAGDADSAFRLNAEMARDGVTVDKQAATSLINACSREIVSTCGSQRRRQLVLLERADGVLQEFVQKQRGRVDQGIWNAFITAAGRAAQLQRAVQALGDMQAKGVKPDEGTFGAMIDACVRNKDKRLAMETYGNAMRAGMVGSLHLHTGAIAACRGDKDMSTALRIFNDLQRHGVQADERLYGVLISVIGSASLPTALDLHEDLLTGGAAPLKGVISNLVDACLENSELDTARSLFDRAHSTGLQLSVHTVNAVLNAFAKTGRLEEVAGLLQRATDAGFEPDKYTYTAVLSACQYANAGHLAFSVWRLMTQQHITLDEASAFILIRTCYNQLQIARLTPEQKEEQQVRGVDRQVELQLLQALAGPGGPAGCAGQEDKMVWGARAVSVYQKLLATGTKPKLHVLERLLACLRLRPLSQKSSPSNSYGAPLKVRLYLHPDGQRGNAPQHSVDGIYETRALSILEEATAMGVLPCYTAGKDSALDLRKIPPVLAEVYVLHVLASVSSADSSGRRMSFPLILRTPPYVPWQRAHGAGGSGSGCGPAVRGQKTEGAPMATGLAVAALLKRLNIRTVGNPAAGDIVLTPNALSRWRQLAERAASNMELESLSSIQKAGHISSSIHGQQMHIRLGMQAENEPAFRQEHGRKSFHHHIPYGPGN